MVSRWPWNKERPADYRQNAGNGKKAQAMGTRGKCVVRPCEVLPPGVKRFVKLDEFTQSHKKGKETPQSKRLPVTALRKSVFVRDSGRSESSPALQRWDRAGEQTESALADD